MWAILMTVLGGFSPRLYMYGLALVSGAAILGGVYWKGLADCSDAARIKGLQLEISILKNNIKHLKRDANQAMLDTAKLDQLRVLANELQTQIDDGICFDSDDYKRLRDIWGNG